MSGLGILQQFLSNNAAREAQERGFQNTRELESQRSVNRASEQASAADLATKGYRSQKEIDQEFAEKDDIRAGKKAVAEFLLKNGMSPDMGAQVNEVFDAGRKQYLASMSEKEQTAKTSALRSNIEEEALTKTRSPEIDRLLSQSRTGAFRAGQSEQFAKENPDAIQAGMLGQELAPAANLARANTLNVGAGEYLKRLTTGNSSFDRFFPGQEGQGMTSSKQTTMQNIGGMQFPVEQQVTTPGSIKQTFSGKIPQAVSSAAPTPQGVASSQQVPQALATSEMFGPAYNPSKAPQEQDIYDIPPDVAAQLQDSRYSPEAKQQLLGGYYKRLLSNAEPSRLSQFLSPESGEGYQQQQKYLRLKKLLSPNY